LTIRILLVSAYYPNDTSFGAGQRTTLLHSALGQVGEVTTLILREGHPLQLKLAPVEGVAAEISYPDSPPWRKYSRVASIGPLVKAAIDIDSFDFVVGRYLGPLLALPQFSGKSIIDADDAYYFYPAHNGLLSCLWSTIKTQGRKLIGQRVLQRVDHVWFCSQLARDQFSLPSSSVLPNVVGITNLDVESVRDANPTVLMVGALWYGPNREGIERFLRTCWPEIRRQIPSAVFRAIGSAPPELRAQWETIAGVECPGFVDDLIIEYRRASLTVVPLNFGGGTQIKALESLAYGRVPVVSSFVASRFAPHLRHGESLLVADEPEEIIDRVVAILKNPDSTVNIARRGQQIVKEIFSPGQFDKVVKATIESLAGTS
jgi:glycosyltransferase involved in cell wall biosynthesis